MTNVENALELVANGMTLGLGSGHAAERFVTALGARVRAGLDVRGVPTSRGTAELAARVGVPLVGLGEALPIDITIDGADEVDPGLNLIKGYGHALVREKVVAAASRMIVILIGPEHAETKLVDVLGRRGHLPVEVVPFALPLCADRIRTKLGFPVARVDDERGDPLVTDNGNLLLDMRVGPIADPTGLELALRSIPGVVGTGLFVGMADVVIVEHGDGRVEVRTRREVR
ncbi:MAG: rpiA [Gemmataceae bacterium]|nr:rpiA [Gemmataceae bacterium]